MLLAQAGRTEVAPEAHEDLRCRVIVAVYGGMRKAEAARTFGVTRQSIHNWLGAIEDAGGVHALRARTRGPKPGTRMLRPH